MRPARRGKIVNMSSAAGIPGLARYAAYSAARAGVNGLTKAVGREVARDGIQVNAIAQNYVENPTYFPPALTADPEKLARMVRHVPAGRLARGEESARLAVYLASEDADFFVGQVIPFAGGWSRRDRLPRRDRHRRRLRHAPRAASQGSPRAVARAPLPGLLRGRRALPRRPKRRHLLPHGPAERPGGPGRGRSLLSGRRVDGVPPAELLAL